MNLHTDIFKSFFLLVIALFFLQACDEPQTKAIPPNESKDFITTAYSKKTVHIDEYNNTKGLWESGDLITEFDCPDAKDFPPIDIKFWDKITVVNHRLPTYEETQNGTSIHHYGEKSSIIMPYYMTLPKLATYYNHVTNPKDIIVVVIQIVQTCKDTVVGFRYLTGGCGGSTFSKFHFLTDEETKSVVNSKL